MRLQPDDIGAALAATLTDARERLIPVIVADYGEGWPVGPDDFAAMLWPQSWGDTSCGFGGVGGQAMTSAYTVVVGYSGDIHAPLAVYHDFRFAYIVRAPTGDFYDRMHRQKVPGRHQFETAKRGRYERVLPGEE